MRSPRIGLLSAWLSRRNGGVFEAVAAQAAILRDRGFTPVVLGLDHPDHAVDRARLAGAEVVACPVAGPDRLGYAPALGRALAHARVDLLHLHGLWTWPSFAGARWARVTGRPYLVSPHGMLDPWILGRGRVAKAVAGLLIERPGWALARLFHALTPAEAADIERATGRPEIAVVPNAVPPVPGPAAGPRPPVLLYLGRLHPKKNVPALVEGWARIRPHLPQDARLDIAGWGRAADVAAVERAVARHPAAVRLLGPLHGAHKAAALAGARFLALPSFGEGLPMAVLEAWAAGTPAILSPACHLPEGETAGAALPCSTDPAGIALAIGRAFAEPEDAWMRRSVAARGLAADRFSPDAVGARWAKIYDGLLGQTRWAAA